MSEKSCRESFPQTTKEPVQLEGQRLEARKRAAPLKSTWSSCHLIRPVQGSCAFPRRDLVYRPESREPGSRARHRRPPRRLTDPIVLVCATALSLMRGCRVEDASVCKQEEASDGEFSDFGVGHVRSGLSPLHGPQQQGACSRANVRVQSAHVAPHPTSLWARTLDALSPQLQRSLSSALSYAQLPWMRAKRFQTAASR